MATASLPKTPTSTSFAIRPVSCNAEFVEAKRALSPECLDGTPDHRPQVVSL